MRSEDRTRARRSLDKKLNPLRDSIGLVRPPKGWVHAVRQALGMTTYQLAARMGVTQPRIVILEKAEARGSITLESLRRAANALDCEVVYALIPRQPLEVLVAERAQQVAKKQLQTTRHTMALEDQQVDPADEERQLKGLVRQLVDQGGSHLWKDET